MKPPWHRQPWRSMVPAPTLLDSGQNSLTPFSVFLLIIFQTNNFLQDKTMIMRVFFSPGEGRAGRQSQTSSCPPSHALAYPHPH